MVTLRQQADMVGMTGREIAEQIKAMRKSGTREAEADLLETRLPILREAFTTINNLAKADAGEQET